MMDIYQAISSGDVTLAVPELVGFRFVPDAEAQLRSAFGALAHIELGLDAGDGEWNRLSRGCNVAIVSLADLSDGDWLLTWSELYKPISESETRQ